MKYFIYSVIGIVVVAIVASFFIIGSPGKERIRKFDDRRVSDLSNLQSEIVNFWRNKDRLPNTLNELESDISYFIVPTDPKTNQPYEYAVLDEYQFELCANFSTESDLAYPRGEPIKPLYGYESKWEHGVGRTCFIRTIDPELHKDDELRPIPTPAL